MKRSISIEKYWSLREEEVRTELYATIPETAYMAYIAEYKAACAGGYDGSIDYTVDANGVATFGITGPISREASFMTYYFGGTSTNAFIDSLNRAAADPSVKGAFTDLETPGGNISGLDLACQAIAGFEKKKPIVGFSGGLCASAGYWLASQFSALYGSPMSIWGHIGVYTTHADTSKMDANMGVKRHLIKSAPYKGIGERGIPIDDEAIAEVQREVDAFHAMFEAAVVSGRGMTPQKVSAVADGRGYIGSQAVSSGLMDGVTDREGAYKKLLKRINDGKPSTTKKGLTDMGLKAKFLEFWGALPDEDDDDKKAKLPVEAATPVVVTAHLAPAQYDVEKDPKYIAMQQQNAQYAEQERIRVAAEANLSSSRNTEIMEAYNREGKFNPAELKAESDLRAENPAFYDKMWKTRPVIPAFKPTVATIDAGRAADELTKTDGKQVDPIASMQASSAHRARSGQKRGTTK